MEQLFRPRSVLLGVASLSHRLPQSCRFVDFCAAGVLEQLFRPRSVLLGAASLSNSVRPRRFIALFPSLLLKSSTSQFLLSRFSHKPFQAHCCSQALNLKFPRFSLLAHALTQKSVWILIGAGKVCSKAVGNIFEQGAATCGPRSSHVESAILVVLLGFRTVFEPGTEANSTVHKH